jgi:hypothetical protein
MRLNGPGRQNYGKKNLLLWTLGLDHTLALKLGHCRWWFVVALKLTWQLKNRPLIQ